jgi:hypothetical protein
VQLKSRRGCVARAARQCARCADQSPSNSASFTHLVTPSFVAHFYSISLLALSYYLANIHSLSMANTRQKALTEAQKAKGLSKGRPVKSSKTRKNASNDNGGKSTIVLPAPKPRARPAYRGANRTGGASDGLDVSEDASLLQAQAQVPQARAQTPQAVQVPTLSRQGYHIEEPEVSLPAIDKVTDKIGTWNGGMGFPDEEATWGDSHDVNHGLENDSEPSDHSSDSDDEEAATRSIGEHNRNCHGY